MVDCAIERWGLFNSRFYIFSRSSADGYRNWPWGRLIYLIRRAHRRRHKSTFYIMQFQYSLKYKYSNKYTILHTSTNSTCDSSQRSRHGSQWLAKHRQCR